MKSKDPFQWVDLTHTLTPAMPSWNGSCGFQHHIKKDYQDSKDEVKFRVQKIEMHAGIGTHMDAPAHCIPGGDDIAKLELERLIRPCVRINISNKAHARYSLTPKDIIEFETEYKKIPQHSFVMVYTGWERYWNDAHAYRNHHIFPGISKEAADLFLERDIAGVGIDTLSPDRPEDGFLVHQKILGAGKLIIENIANALKLPPTGSTLLALPIKMEGAAESPIRLVGMIGSL